MLILNKDKFQQRSYVENILSLQDLLEDSNVGYHNQHHQAAAAKLNSAELDLTTQTMPESGGDMMVGEATPERKPVMELVTHLNKDMFNLYSLTFTSRTKDLSERRIKLDFGLEAEVTNKLIQI